MNVRSLISQFENILDNSKDRGPLKTPKGATRSFSKSTDSLIVQPDNQEKPAIERERGKESFKSNERKLADIEEDIQRTKNRIGTDDDVISVVLELLDLLIKVAQIDTDGNVRAKQKKTACFALLQECKNNLQDKYPTHSEDKIETKTTVSDTKIAVSQTKSSVETIKNEPTVAPKEEPVSETIVESKDEPKEPEANTSEQSTTASTSSLLQESDSVIRFKSVKDMMQNFESKSKTSAKLPTPSFRKLVVTADDDVVSPTSESSEASTVVRRELSPPPKSPGNSDDEEKFVSNDIADRLNNLCVEIEYYRDIVNDLDPEDDIRIEILEDNLSCLLSQLDNLNTAPELAEKKAAALKAARVIWDNFNLKKVGGELTIDEDIFEDMLQMNKSEEEENVATFELLSELDAFYDELVKYKVMIEDLDEHDFVRISVLKENIWDISTQLNQFDTFSNNNLTDKKQESTNLVEELNEKLALLESKGKEQHMQTLHNEIQLYEDLEVKAVKSGEIKIIHEKVMKIYEHLGKLEVESDELVYGKRKGMEKIMGILERLTKKIDNAAETVLDNADIKNDNEIVANSQEGIDNHNEEVKTEPVLCEKEEPIDNNSPKIVEDEIDIDATETENAISPKSNEEPNTIPASETNSVNEDKECAPKCFRINTDDLNNCTPAEETADDIKPNQPEEAKSEVVPDFNFLLQLCSQIKHYKNEAPKMDLSDTIKTNETVKDINHILSQVDAIQVTEDEEFAKKLSCMKDIVEILKIFNNRKPAQEQDNSTSMKKLWAKVTAMVKSARTDLENGVEGSKELGDIIGNMMHLRELVKKEKVDSKEDEELQTASLDQLSETIKMINPDLI